MGSVLGISPSMRHTRRVPKLKKSYKYSGTQWIMGVKERCPNYAPATGAIEGRHGLHGLGKAPGLEKFLGEPGSFRSFAA